MMNIQVTLCEISVISALLSIDSKGNKAVHDSEINAVFGKLLVYI